MRAMKSSWTLLYCIVEHSRRQCLAKVLLCMVFNPPFLSRADSTLATVDMTTVIDQHVHHEVCKYHPKTSRARTEVQTKSRES